MENDRSTYAVLVGFAAGALLAVLFAPRSGEQTRLKLTNTRFKKSSSGDTKDGSPEKQQMKPQRGPAKEEFENLKQESSFQP
jgi:gas vesicle protein